MTWITVYDKVGVDHMVNVDHIIEVWANENRTYIGHVRGSIEVVGTPNCPDGRPDDIHQDVIDQIGGRA